MILQVTDHLDKTTEQPNFLAALLHSTRDFDDPVFLVQLMESFTYAAAKGGSTAALASGIRSCAYIYLTAEERRKTSLDAVADDPPQESAHGSPSAVPVLLQPSSLEQLVLPRRQEFSIRELVEVADAFSELKSSSAFPRQSLLLIQNLLKDNVVLLQQNDGQCSSSEDVDAADAGVATGDSALPEEAQFVRGSRSGNRGSGPVLAGRAYYADLSLFDCARLANALAKLRVADPRVFDRIAEKMRHIPSSQELAEEMEPDVSDWVHCSSANLSLAIETPLGRDGTGDLPVGRLRHSDKFMFRLLKEARLRRMSGSGIAGQGHVEGENRWDKKGTTTHVQDTLSRLAYGFAKFQNANVLVFDALATHSRRKLNHFGMSELSLLLPSFARTGVQNQVLLARAVGRVKQWGPDSILEDIREGECTFQEVLNVAMAFAKFQVGDEKLLRGVFSPVFRSFLPVFFASGADEDDAKNLAGEGEVEDMHIFDADVLGEAAQSVARSRPKFGRSSKILRDVDDEVALPLPPEEEAFLLERYAENRFHHVPTEDWMNVVQVYGKSRYADEPLLRGISDLIRRERLVPKSDVVFGQRGGGRGVGVSGKSDILTLADALKYAHACAKLDFVYKPLVTEIVQKLKRECRIEQMSPFEALKLSRDLTKIGGELYELETYIGSVLPNEMRSSVGVCRKNVVSSGPQERRKSARKRKLTW